MNKDSLILVFTELGLLCLLSSPAYATCSIPNSISNGQVADAAKVMENFNAVATCADQAAATVGTPAPGQIAVISGTKDVTGGNLTGDVTTSGGTSTTLASSGVTPGTYVNPTIAVDAKGRVTSAFNGAGGGGGTSGLVLISTATADGTSGVITFSNIPQVYQDLVLVVTGQSVNANQDMAAYANGDTTNGDYTNWTWNMFGEGASTTPRISAFPGQNVPTVGSVTSARAEFFSYASSVWKKNAISDLQYQDNQNFFRDSFSWKWNNTSPITQLSLQLSSGNFVSGSTFSLYGRGGNPN